jgi:hypothetical protein
MSIAKIINVDSVIAKKLALNEAGRVVEVKVPNDREVEIRATVNASLSQRARIWDRTGKLHFEWEGRGKGRSIGSGSSLITEGKLWISCMFNQHGGSGWINCDLNVAEELDDAGNAKVTIKCEDGGEVPGDWEDLVVELGWKKD